MDLKSKKSAVKSFKTAIKALKAKIKKENLLLLDETDSGYVHNLEKMLDWQEEYNFMEWEEFKENWFYCERCDGYSEGQCICYAR